MGPKTFVACYVCLKEFGSRSIPFHEPRCLERWRASNRSLPEEKRSTTPVKKDLPWKDSHCQVSGGKKTEPALPKSKPAPSLQSKNGQTPPVMTGVVKADYSPKKGKENKNISNHIPIPSNARKNAKTEAKSDLTSKKEKVEETNGTVLKKPTTDKSSRARENATQNSSKEEDSSSSTSNRSVRPQTKILRRPTPNLKHPVIQVDSDDSGGDSSSSDKSKDDNPKRLKMGSENADLAHKRKNFIMFNKYNVDKNKKKGEKDRTPPSSLPTSIPNPCNSCSRSQAPERLHSHARKDARGLMSRRSPSMDVKMASPQKKPAERLSRDRVKDRGAKSIPTLVTDCSKEDTQNISSGPSPAAEIECQEVTASDDSGSEGTRPSQDFVDPLKACYICQKEFNVSSLLLHESKCLETWKKTNNSLTPNLRQLPPRRREDICLASPVSDEDDPAWSAVQSQLIPCALCGRTFFPERLPVHRRVCKGKQSPRPLKRASSLREQSASSTDGEEPKPAPLYLPCYICNRNYGSWVLPMHEQQCLKKWKKENKKLSEEQNKSSSSLIDEDVASLVELGDNAWENHLEQLVPCPRCSRTFFPDRLEIHQRSCKGPANGRRPRSNKGI